jgi:hypothetical protein
MTIKTIGGLSRFAETVGHPLAEAKGIPSLGVRLQQCRRPRSIHRPSLVPGRPGRAEIAAPPRPALGWSTAATAVWSPTSAPSRDCVSRRLAACVNNAPLHNGLSCTGIRRRSHPSPRTAVRGWRPPGIGGRRARTACQVMGCPPRRRYRGSPHRTGLLVRQYVPRPARNDSKIQEGADVPGRV